MDLGAERLISAEKGTRKIVVEIKSFVGRSDIKDLQQALGQYMMYYQVLIAKNIDRELYLAIPYRTYKNTFQNEIGQLLLQNELLRLIVFDEEQEVIHHTPIHIDIVNAKIWIQYDDTEEGVATDLLEAGVPHHDIVLGFRPAELRQHTEFAVA